MDKTKDSKNSEVNITYETLFEIFRMEKNRPELQKLDKDFYSHVADYLNDKLQILNKQGTQLDLFMEDEKTKTSKQIKEIKDIIKKLYALREKKITEMSLNKAKTSSSIVDSTSLLEEENRMFDMLVETLTGFRKGVLDNVLLLKEPCADSIEKPEKDSAVEEKSKDATAGKKELIQLRFLHAVPKFLGEELEIYGPFEEGDMASLPSAIARVLIEKERAEKIESE